MLTFSLATSTGQRVPHWPQQQRTSRGIGQRTDCHTELLEHVTVLAQAAMAMLEGYLRGPLYHRAARAVQRLPALTAALAWREGTRVAHALAHLFCPATAFDLVHALHLAELLAAFYREMVRASAGQPPPSGRDVAGLAAPPVPQAPGSDDGATVTDTRDIVRAGIACCQQQHDAES
jgi:hypothetical protein